MSQARIQLEAGSKQTSAFCGFTVKSLWFISTEKTTILPFPTSDPENVFLATPSSCSLSLFHCCMLVMETVFILIVT
jgi:hypothetical protein